MGTTTTMHDELQPLTIAGEDARGFPARTPPAELISHPKIHAAAVKWERARDEAQEAAQRLTEATEARVAADEADRELYAAAIRAGKPDPGTPNGDRADAEIEQARRRSEALALIEQEALGELREAGTRYQESWYEHSVKDREARRRTIARQVDDLAASMHELDRVEALVRYVGGRSWGLAANAEPPEIVTDPRQTQGVSTAQALGVLHSRAVPPAPLPQRPQVGMMRDPEHVR